VKRCLELLSGARHQVIRQSPLLAPNIEAAHALWLTRVAFKNSTPRKCRLTRPSGEGEGKAGGYAITGRAEAFVRFINAPTATS
jgi:septum formation protein